MKYESRGSLPQKRLVQRNPLPDLIVNQKQMAFDLERKIIDLQNENLLLKNAILDCLEENAHLADGENCTLIALKRAIGKV